MSDPHRRGSGQVSLARAISKLGIASRSQAAGLIASGVVTVNGVPARDANRWVDLKTDRLAIKGKPLRPQKRIYLMLHKPPGVVTTRSDERDRKTVYDLLPAGHPWVFPVGRLDQDSSGLLLLTNDTRFGESVTNPLDSVGKTYQMDLDAPLSPAHLETMRTGMTLKDGTRLLPAVVESTGGTAYEITITEGKNRQIRKMCFACGREVLTLRRVKIGRLRLGDLPEGTLRPLTREELTYLGIHQTEKRS